MEVNIYTMTTYRRPNQKRGGYGFVLESMTSKGPATYTRIGVKEEHTPNEAEAAVFRDALRMITKQCKINLFTESSYVAGGIEYLASWESNDFKTKQGKEVFEAWKEIAELLRGKEIEVHLKEAHSYKEWLTTQSTKEEKKNVV